VALSSYKSKMSDFKIYATFYINVERTLDVLGRTEDRMGQLQSELILFEEDLAKTRLKLDGGQAVPLQIYMDI
jgi:hypothetical protein